jgi:hypothetical protein
VSDATCCLLQFADTDLGLAVLWVYGDSSEEILL